jgi:hypothetical protein
MHVEHEMALSSNRCRRHREQVGVDRAHQMTGTGISGHVGDVRQGANMNGGRWAKCHVLVLFFAQDGRMTDNDDRFKNVCASPMNRACAWDAFAAATALARHFAQFFLNGTKLLWARRLGAPRQIANTPQHG